MKYTELGRTSMAVSRICCGTWQFGGDWGKFERREAKLAIRAALNLGVNFFDTAQAYGFGVSEQLLGEALKPDLKIRRDDLYIATKGGLRLEGSALLRDSSPEWIRKGVEDSLRNLGVEYIDLYQVHWPDPHTPPEATAAALKELIDECKIRHVGVSNFDVAQMKEFAKTLGVETLQPPYHMFRRDIEDNVLGYCRDYRIGVLVYGPLAHGLLGGRYTPATRFTADDWRSKSPAFRGELFERNLEVVGRLKALAESLGLKVGQLAVAWILANPAVNVAIVGARRPEQMIEIMPAADVRLSSETMDTIETILRDAVPTGGPSPEGM
ncbi:MAG: aldo/keto reductase [Candidatus Sumerlaeia bacterium]